MSTAEQSKFRVPTYIYLIIILADTILFLISFYTTYHILSSKEIMMFLLSGLGAFGVIDEMAQANADSLLKRQQMFFIAILMSAIVLVAIFLSVSPASIFLSVLSIATLDFSVLISIRLVNWSVKRKQSQTNENP